MDKHNTHASVVLASFFKNTSVVPGGVADNCYEGIVWGDVPLNQRPSKEQFEARKAEMDRQIQMNLLRQERNSKLQSTDFLMTSDFPFPSEDIREAWKTYRTALRNMTVTTTPVFDQYDNLLVTWPSPPLWPPNVV